jgi:ATP-dependent Clp protease ATP-binding subunit ClpE
MDKPCPVSRQALRDLEPLIRRHLIGQDEPVSEACALLRRTLLGARYDGQPVASLLLAGPTGTGKTAFALLSAEHLFGPGSLAWFDMAEYQTLDSLDRLIGKPGQEGLMGMHLDATNGQGAILFDEVEKAHPDLINFLMAVLDKGRFTTGAGRTLDLTQHVIFCTTNLGSSALMAGPLPNRAAAVETTLMGILAGMRPELFARYDRLVCFNRFGEVALKAIADLKLKEAVAVLAGRGHRLRVQGDGLLLHLQSEGFTNDLGARPVRNRAMDLLGGVIDQALLQDDALAHVCGTVGFDYPLRALTFSADATFE